MSKRYLLVVTLLLVSFPVESAFIIIDGKGGDFWTRNSIVLVSVTNCERIERGRYSLEFTPLATLSGRFDCGVHAAMAVSFEVGSNSHIMSLPKPGKYILLLEEIQLEGKAKYWIPSHTVSFSPNRSSIIPVSGIDDELVQEMIDSVRKIRMGEGEKKEEEKRGVQREK